MKVEFRSIYLLYFQSYLSEMLSASTLPQAIAGKDEVIFGNILEIYEFHQWYDVIPRNLWLVFETVLFNLHL